MIVSNSKFFGMSEGLRYTSTPDFSSVKLLLFNCIAGHSVLIKKSVLPDISLWPDNIFAYDAFFGYIISAKGNAVYYDEALTLCRRHENCVCGVKCLKNKIK